MGSLSKSIIAVLSVTFATSLVASALPIAALAPVGAAPMPALAPVALDACEPETAGFDLAAAASLAVCAGVHVANGDFDAAQATALRSASLAYGPQTMPPHVLETYAHQYAVLQNPVLNPGFLLDETKPHSSDPHVGAWEGNFRILDGALVVRADETAVQTFGAARSGEAIETGDVAASPYWGPDVLSLDYEGAGTLTITLLYANADVVPVAIALPDQDEMANARFDLREAIGGTLLGMPTEEVLPASAVLRLDVATSSKLAIDNVVLDGVAYGPDPRAAVDLDAAMGDVAGRFLPDLTSPFGHAHDGYSTLILPLEYVPKLVSTDPRALAGNVETFALAGSWTFFVGVVEHAPSGATFVTPTSLRLETSKANPKATQMQPLAQQGDAGATFAALFASQGLEGAMGGVVQIDITDPTDLSNLWANAQLPASRYGENAAEGFFHYAKLATPGRAMNDLRDGTPDTLYPARETLAAATYAGERRWDTNDGYVGTLRPHGALPAGPMASAETILLPDPEGNYRLDLQFQDYRGGTIVGQYAFVAFFSPEGFTAAQQAIADGNPEWFELAEFRACSAQPSFLTCEVEFGQASDGLYDVEIPVKLFQTMQDGLGGEFFAIAFLHVPGAPVDEELLGTIPARAAYNPVVNALVDMAADFGASWGATKVGPYWLYAIADAHSMSGVPLQFAPAADALDGYAVLIEPRLLDDAGTVLPNLHGDYVFDVRFRAYENGAPRADEARLNPDYFGFHLTDAQAQATGSLWSRRTSDDAATDWASGSDRYTVHIPAYEIPLASAAETGWLQPLSAWSSTWHPAWTGDLSDYRRDWVTDDDGHLVGGFYHPQKNALAMRPIADQLDMVPGSFLLDRGAETYGIEVTAVQPAMNVDRAKATHVNFVVKNTGAFIETLELAFVAPTDANLAVAFAPGSASSLTLFPGSSEVVTLVADVAEAVPNAAAFPVSLVASLSHPVAPGETLEPVAAAATLTVGPLAFEVENIGAPIADIVPGASGTFAFELRNTGGVTETFAITAQGNSDLDPVTWTPAAPTRLAPGGARLAQATARVVPTAFYGSSGALTLTATPQHGGATLSDAVTIRVPDSSIVVTPLSGDRLNAKPGDDVSFTFRATYSGPYTETFAASATFGVLGDLAHEIRVDDVPTTAITFAGTGTKDVTLSFRVPDTTDFGTIAAVKLSLDTTNTPQSDAKASASRAVHLVSATLTPSVPGIQFGLQGDELTWTVPFAYAGPVAWSFDLALEDVPAGIEAVTLSTPRLDFAASGTQTVTVTGTLADALAFGDAKAFRIGIASASGSWRGATLADVPLTGQVFSVSVPVLEQVEAHDIHAYPRDVEVAVGFTVGFTLPSAAERAAWGTRTVAFELTAEHAAGAWSDTTLAPVVATAGVPVSVTFEGTPTALETDDVLTLTASALGLAHERVGSVNVPIELYTPADFVVHSMLVGCYGESAETCDRVVGPIQSLATHDLPGSSYSRVWVVAAPILVHDDAASYVPFNPANPDPASSGIAGAAVVTANGVDATVQDALVVSQPSRAGDERFQVLETNGQLVALPEQPGLGPALKTRSGVTALLWETGGEDADTRWFLERLGSLSIRVDLDVHGVPVSGLYAPERAIFPLAPTAADAGVALVLTDKDDHDGDGFATATELRSNSNPLLRSSTPYTDEDEDGYVNLRDVVGFLHEECLMQDAEDSDWTACLVPQAGVAAAAPGVSFGPPELAYYVSRIAQAYAVGGGA